MVSPGCERDGGHAGLEPRGPSEWNQAREEAELRSITVTTGHLLLLRVTPVNHCQRETSRVNTTNYFKWIVPRNNIRAEEAENNSLDKCL